MSNYKRLHPVKLVSKVGKINEVSKAPAKPAVPALTVDKMIRAAVRGEKLRLCSQFHKKLIRGLELLNKGDIMAAKRCIASLKLEVYDVMDEDRVPLSSPLSATTTRRY